MKRNSTIVVIVLVAIQILSTNFNVVKAQSICTAPAMVYTNPVLVSGSANAVVANNNITLNWLTTQEVNTSHFDVERAFEINNFNTIGLVLDGFTNGNNKSYSFKDNSPELTGKSIAYYRLKQFDVDGKFTYSKILAMRLHQANPDVVMQVSPNPFMENLNVRFSSNESGTVQIHIMNMSGQTLLSKQSAISKGYVNINVDGLSGLSTGMYVARLVMNGTIIDNQRIIKNK